MKATLCTLFLIALSAMGQDGMTQDLKDRVAKYLAEQKNLRSRVSANYIFNDGHKLKLEGEVEIRTMTVTVRADSAVLDTDTGEIQANGNVRIFPVSLTPSASTLQPGRALAFTPGMPTPVDNSPKP